MFLLLVCEYTSETRQITLLSLEFFIHIKKSKNSRHISSSKHFFACDIEHCQLATSNFICIRIKNKAWIFLPSILELKY